jgi:uncharacterized membrane protein
MSKTRLEAFSDGVFAIVITLLVLELRPEEGAAHAREMILHAFPRMLAFGLSFVVIGSYWVAHHRLLHYFRAVDRVLLWINLALLMVVAFIPYPTALIGATHGDVAAVQLYGLTLILANLLGVALWLYGTRPANEPASLLPGQRSHTAVAHAAPVLVYAGAIAVAPVSATVALACYVAVPLFFIIAGPAMDRLLASRRD